MRWSDAAPLPAMAGRSSSPGVLKRRSSIRRWRARRPHAGFKCPWEPILYRATRTAFATGSPAWPLADVKLVAAALVSVLPPIRTTAVNAATFVPKGSRVKTAPAPALAEVRLAMELASIRKPTRSTAADAELPAARARLAKTVLAPARSR